jgi:hypothetical protein
MKQMIDEKTGVYIEVANTVEYKLSKSSLLCLLKHKRLTTIVEH